MNCQLLCISTSFWVSAHPKPGWITFFVIFRCFSSFHIFFFISDKIEGKQLNNCVISNWGLILKTDQPLKGYIILAFSEYLFLYDFSIPVQTRNCNQNCNIFIWDKNPIGREVKIKAWPYPTKQRAEISTPKVLLNFGTSHPWQKIED